MGVRIPLKHDLVPTPSRYALWLEQHSGQHPTGLRSLLRAGKLADPRKTADFGVRTAVSTENTCSS